MSVRWWAGLPEDAPAGDGPLAWSGRLDGPVAAALAARAALMPADLADLATRAGAAERGVRRRIVRALLAHAAGVHPDAIRLARTPAGATVVVEPAGWWVSVAGQPPLCAVAVVREPVGIDIERADTPPLPEAALAPAERVDPDPVRWIVKEAHAKRLGIASHIEPDAIVTARDGAGWTAWSDGGRSQCAVWVADGATVAVALPFGSGPPAPAVAPAAGPPDGTPP